MPKNLLLKICNLWLLAGYLPKVFRHHKTTLIPKNDSPESPADFRPITVPSALVRVFHEIFAARCTTSFNLNPIQRAFIPVSGCEENIFLPEFLLKYNKPTFIALLDIQKAFDIVHHDSIMRGALRQLAPRHFI